MTSLAATPGRTTAVSRLPGLAEFFRREPLFAGTAVCLAVAMLPTALAMALDPRTLLGVNVWMKPLKFEIALIVYTLTLAWFAGWLPKGTTQKAWYRRFSAVVAFCIIAEIAWLLGAAALGEASHFNRTNPVLAALYPVMGLFAVILTSAAAVYGVLILRDASGALSPAFRLSLGLGLVLTFVLTVIVAGFMSGWNSHFVGGNPSDAEGLPFVGWARDGGDLRVAHFFATHAMHIIPLFGFAVSRMLGAGQARMAVIAFSAVFTVLVGYCFAEALMGLPFLSAIS